MFEQGAIYCYGDRIRIPGADDHLLDEADIAKVGGSSEETFRKTRIFVGELYRKNI
ncbi:hypothetical protein [Neobacillus endophyticus]|uniref:hypothetical protein n=1 Tax=Neobacillus endophyticus TaxID=2738405 RepID=UPI001C2545D8|nr:hypothetical protein [Neobacillus endophyticus]